MSKRKEIPEPLRSPNLFHPVFRALKQLGGSGTIEEIDNEVIRAGNFSDALVNLSHGEKSYMTELEYGTAWARTILKKVGVLTNSDRGVWVIALEYTDVPELPSPTVINKAFRAGILLSEQRADANAEETTETEDTEPNDTSWMRRLSEVLKAMNPFAFERLAQRLLRECGFSNVKITKKTGDGGIDGTAAFKVNDIFSFSVAFQCKRYSGVVGAPEIRDFRGSLASDIEKGVFITTGTFTAKAKEEAFAPGKKQIDLMDGEAFMEKLAEHQMGLKEVIIRDYQIDAKFFEEI